jgi:hypothetical protein
LCERRERRPPSLDGPRRPSRQAVNDCHRRSEPRVREWAAFLRARPAVSQFGDSLKAVLHCSVGNAMRSARLSMFDETIGQRGAGGSPTGGKGAPRFRRRPRLLEGAARAPRFPPVSTGAELLTRRTSPVRKQMRAVAKFISSSTRNAARHSQAKGICGESLAPARRAYMRAGQSRGRAPVLTLALARARGCSFSSVSARDDDASRARGAVIITGAVSPAHHVMVMRRWCQDVGLDRVRWREEGAVTGRGGAGTSRDATAVMIVGDHPRSSTVHHSSSWWQLPLPAGPPNATPPYERGRAHVLAGLRRRSRKPPGGKATRWRVAKSCSGNRVIITRKYRGLVFSIQRIWPPLSLHSHAQFAPSPRARPMRSKRGSPTIFETNVSRSPARRRLKWIDHSEFINPTGRARRPGPRPSPPHSATAYATWTRAEPCFVPLLDRGARGEARRPAGDRPLIYQTQSARESGPLPRVARASRRSDYTPSHTTRKTCGSRCAVPEGGRGHASQHGPAPGDRDDGSDDDRARSRSPSASGNYHH